MSGIELTERERYLVRHALGMGTVNRAKVAYRNYFAISPACGGDYVIWQGLVDKGLADVTRPGEGERLAYFAAGHRLAIAVCAEGESLDRETEAHARRVDDDIAASRAAVEAIVSDVVNYAPPARGHQ